MFPSGYIIGEAGESAVNVYTPVKTNPTKRLFQIADLAPIAQASAPSYVEIFTDANNNPIDLSNKTLRLVFAIVTDEVDQDLIFDDTLEGSFKYETGAGLTLGGTDNNEVTVQHDATKTATAGAYRYFFWIVDDQVVLKLGNVEIQPTVFNV
jgi:hypothetical protein